MDIEQEYIKNVDNLVPRHDIALEVLNMAHDSNCSIMQLATLAEKDPSLTANMLRLANSAYFGHMKKITSIKDIIVRLGLETVKLLAISSASVGILKSPQESYNLEPGDLWDHSYATAVLASVIGRHAKARETSALYTAALLHDVGKILLNRPLQQASISAGEEIKETDTVGREYKLLHTDHARVGMALLRKWGLSDQVTVPIALHHNRTHKMAEHLNCRIIYLTNWLEENLKLHSILPDEFEPDEQWQADNRELMESVPNFADNFTEIITEFFENYEDSKTLLIL